MCKHTGIHHLDNKKYVTVIYSTLGWFIVVHSVIEFVYVCRSIAKMMKMMRTMIKLNFDNIHDTLIGRVSVRWI